VEDITLCFGQGSVITAKVIKRAVVGK
jgi:hypothetical protein